MFTKIEATDSFYNKVNVTINPLINVLGGYNSIKKEKGNGKLPGATLHSGHFSRMNKINKLIHRIIFKFK